MFIKTDPRTDLEKYWKVLVELPSKNLVKVSPRL